MRMTNILISNILWAILIVAMPSTAVQADMSADTVVDVLCRKDQYKTLTRLGRTGLNEVVKCHKFRIRGRIDPATDCNDLANAPSTRRMAREQDKVAKRIDNSCAGGRRPAAADPIDLGYETCSAPCDLVDIDNSWPGQTSCILCLADLEIEALGTSLFGTPPVPLSRSQDRCQLKIGTAARNYYAHRARNQEKCQKAKDNGDIPLSTDCRADDPKGKVARARATLQKSIARCSDADLAAPARCGATVAAAPNCVDAVYPPIPEEATPTATVTNTPLEPTPTNTSPPPTVTDTPVPPTPTATPVPPTPTPELCNDVECPEATDCLAASSCDPTNGECSSQQPINEDGPCTDGNNSGTCSNGACVPIDDGDESILVWNSNSSFAGGNLGSRFSTSAICQSSIPASVICDGNATALLSYTGDAVIDLPGKTGWSTSIPIGSASGVSLAADWSDFTDGSWNNSVGTAFGSIQAWTGSDANGSLSNNCNNWADTNSTAKLVGPKATSFEAPGAPALVCSNGYEILCACQSSSGGASGPADCTEQPPPVSNGNFSCTLPAPSGSTCKPNCFGGYSSFGEATCEDGSWNSSSTGCHAPV